MNLWELPENLADGTEIHAPAWRRLFKAAPAGVNAALGALGAGVVSGWEVTKNGGTLTIGAGRGIAQSAATGFVGLESEGQTLAYDAENPFVFAAIRVAQGVGAPDSRESGAVEFLNSDSDELEGALLLAQIFPSGVVSDRRDFFAMAQLQNALSALEAAIGVPYDVAALGTIKNRIATLEGGGENGGVLWGTLQKSGGDTSTIDQAIDGKIAAYAATAPESGGATVPLPPIQRDEICVNMLENRYLHLLNNDNIESIAPHFRGFVISPGRGNFNDIVALEHTTVALDYENHTIG